MQSQQIQVGDTVQLTASVLFGLHDQNKEAYDRLMEGRRTGGKVVDLSDNHIAVDIGQEEPIVLEIDTAGRDIALQLVQKGEGNLDSEAVPQDGAKDVAKDADPRQPGPQPGPFPGSMTGFPFELPGGVPIMQVVSHGMQMPGIFQQQQPQIEQTVPQTVRLSQWVILQFIGLKQYGIVQDLNRNDDAGAPSPDPTGDAWKKKDLRAVQVELTTTEEGLYNAALTSIKDWITGPKPKAAHPELTAGPVTLPTPDGPPESHLAAPESTGDGETSEE